MIIFGKCAVFALLITSLAVSYALSATVPLKLIERSKFLVHCKLIILPYLIVHLLQILKLIAIKALTMSWVLFVPMSPQKIFLMLCSTLALKIPEVLM